MPQRIGHAGQVSLGIVGVLHGADGRGVGIGHAGQPAAGIAEIEVSAVVIAHAGQLAGRIVGQQQVATARGSDLGDLHVVGVVEVVGRALGGAQLIAAGLRAAQATTAGPVPLRLPIDGANEQAAVGQLKVAGGVEVAPAITPAGVVGAPCVLVYKAGLQRQSTGGDKQIIADGPQAKAVDADIEAHGSGDAILSGAVEAGLDGGDESRRWDWRCGSQGACRQHDCQDQADDAQAIREKTGRRMRIASHGSPLWVCSPLLSRAFEILSSR